MDTNDNSIHTTLDPTTPSVDITGSVTVHKSELDKIKRLLEHAQENVAEAKELFRKLVEKKSYKEIPGVEGIYDGFQMVDDNGVKHDVPANYAAKSRLVYGDKLKMVEEEGKQLFKQIEKMPRKSLTGVVSKKEGKWHVLTEVGSYLLSERAAEFNNLQLGDKVEVLVPEQNLTSPFATLDKVLTPKESDIVKLSPAKQVAVSSASVTKPKEDSLQRSSYGSSGSNMSSSTSHRPSLNTSAGSKPSSSVPRRSSVRKPTPSASHGSAATHTTHQAPQVDSSANWQVPQQTPPTSSAGTTSTTPITEDDLR